MWTNKDNSKWFMRGYTFILNSALVEHKLSNSELVILSYLGYRTSNGKFEVFIQNQEIARDCKFHYNTVCNALRKLTKSKLIDRKFINHVNNNRRIIWNVQSLVEMNNVDLPWTN